MSRIRDALRRAEQERVRTPSRGASGEHAAASASEAVSPVTPAPPKPAASGHAAAIAAALPIASPDAAAAVAPPGPPNSSSLAGLLVSCRRPIWQGEPGKLLLLGNSGHTLATEQLRNLRTRLTGYRAQRALKSVVISSALDSEGKTFLAANLAHAFARQHDRKILLVDADLRGGAPVRRGAPAEAPGQASGTRLHALLGAPAAPGLSEFLYGAATEEEILQRGPQENLFFLPGGRAAANSGELLAGAEFKSLLSRLAPLFDWILVDTPPVCAMPDARLVAEACDGVVLVIHSGSTPRAAARQAADAFPSERLLGVVLNQAAIRT